MSEAIIQTSFNAGEWGPGLYARVDLAKYRQSAALLYNWFIDYRGGASTRPGLEYCLQAYRSEYDVRIITFQASFNVGYALELGQNYMRFYYDGTPILEDGFAITAATKADPCVLTIPGNNYAIDDWIYVSGVVGMTQLNGKYFKVLNVVGNDVTIGAILDGANINSTGYGTYVSGGDAYRVYTIPTPWAADDLHLLKFAVDVNVMRFVHPDYPPYILTFIDSDNWTVLPILIGAQVQAPTGILVSTTLSSGNVHYSYQVTAVDANGEESVPSSVGALPSVQDIRTVVGTNTVSWTAVPGAQYYKVYKSELSYAGAIPAGASRGYIGFTTTNSFADSNIAPDFSDTPPVAQNPFQGSGVQSITVTAPGSYTTVPTASVAAAPSGGQTATIQPVLTAQTATPIGTSQPGAAVGQIYTAISITGGLGGLSVRVTALSGPNVSAVEIVNPGAIRSGAVPGPGTVLMGISGVTATFIDFTWGVGIVDVVSPGAGYLTAPAVTFSSGAATATSVLAPSTAGNPAAIGVFQQRQVYGGPAVATLQFNMSQPGSPNNFNVSNPIKGSDAIQGQLRSQVLNTIKAFVAMPSGLICLTDRQAWLINAGTSNEAVTQANVTANPQAYNGISEVPPILANFDILYVQAKGSSVRNLSYNFQMNVFTGTDITVQSSHLFFDYTVREWAWAEEPFKVVWCVRNDGVALSLTFLKEQEFIAWAHSHTDGDFKSVTVVTEPSMNSGTIDRPYFVVEREIDSNVVKYIERMAERAFPNGVVDAWCVDAGIEYEGPPQSNFTGGEHLAGKMCTGLADGVVIPEFEMPADGNFTLASPASKIVVGLPYVCDLQTMALDIGDPTVQGKLKQVPYVDVRVANTLGLQIGGNFNNMVEMKDLVVGNVSSMRTGLPASEQTITDLVTGDARTRINAAYTVTGQYCIRQDKPLPATVLGLIPNVAVGDNTGDGRGRRAP